MDVITGLPHKFPSAECPSIEQVFGREGGGSVSTAEAWVQRELEYYESSYTTIDDLHVSVTTFNVGSRKPSGRFAELLAGQTRTEAGAATNLIVLALQEIDMSARAMFMEETEAATAWVQMANAAVGADYGGAAAGAPYHAFAPKQLVGLLLCVFLRRGLLPYVSAQTTMTVATGTMSSMGNKGAVGLHLVLHRTSLCLISAHLASGQLNTSKRNQDIHSILQGMDFNAMRRATAQLGGAAASNAATAPSGLASYAYAELLPRDHDLVLVAGDLNYRLNLSYEQAVELARRRDIAELVRHDQLKAEMANALTPWHGFTDFTPTFLPTYRYDMGTSTYDTSEKHRVPSYTDRVCLYARRAQMRERIGYDHICALDEITLSDHKPVQARLRLPISIEVPTEKARVTAELREKVHRLGLDRASNTKTSVSATSLDFGEMQFHKAGVRHVVTVTNIGDCVAEVRVLRQCAGDVSEGAWLRVTPVDFALLPGESQEMTLETRVQAACMPWLAQWRPYERRGSLELLSMLLVCVHHGPVHALDCKVVLQPSVFGNALENIAALGNLPCVEAYAMSPARLEEGEQDTEGNVETKEDEDGDAAAATAPALGLPLRPQIPKELWFMADAIVRQPREPGLFTTSTDVDECAAVMHFLDTHSEPLPLEFSPLAVAECLLIFLRNLQEPVIPYTFYSLALAAGRARGAEAVQLLRKLPTMNANMWIYLMSLLNFLLQPSYMKSNQLNPTLLAQIFSAALIVRSPGGNAVPPAGVSSAGGGGGGGNVGPTTSAARAPDGGFSQQLRKQLQSEREDACALVEFFLSTPAALLQSYW